MFSVFFLVVTLLLALSLGVVGVMTIVTGRMPLRWLRREVRHPLLWGAGALVEAAALLIVRIVPFEVSTPIFMAGLLLCAASSLVERRVPAPRAARAEAE
ncbi:hypothetical protein GL263_01560 [Streptomyces durbertensis]|uniref:Integral membrane protein n=1 Tax=Streptomyces durbertensis TaxID=2448886 RepID=A0ABR6EAB5_9ACTN|nr:hypothetical protein [Streptomyces durbertensis]MBB1242268.1 hypothetical protein [Streptomyces durbertensis]